MCAKLCSDSLVRRSRCRPGLVAVGVPWMSSVDCMNIGRAENGSCRIEDRLRLRTPCRECSSRQPYSMKCLATHPRVEWGGKARCKILVKTPAARRMLWTILRANTIWPAMGCLISRPNGRKHHHPPQRAASAASRRSWASTNLSTPSCSSCSATCSRSMPSRVSAATNACAGGSS